MAKNTVWMPPPIDMLADQKFPNNPFKKLDELREDVDNLMTFYDDFPARAVYAVNTNNVTVPVLVTFLTGTSTWTPGVIANNTKVSTNLSFLRANVGDIVSASFTGLTAGVLLQGIVIADGVVQVTLINISGASVTLGQGTLRVTVTQHQ